MKKRPYYKSAKILLFIWATCFILIVQSTLAFAANDLDTKLDELARQISISMAEGNKTKIAVIEFSDLDGKVTEFGKFLSEELITRFFMTKKFEVVERQLLNKVLEEHKLSLTGVIDEATAKQLGRILGVDAIASGTITDLVNTVKVNARLIATETGTIFAVAAVEILKDETVKKLMGKAISDSPIPPKPPTKSVQSSTGEAGNIFFKEDFSGYDIGDPAPNWGADVVVLSREGAKKYLTTQIDGDHYIQQKITFPQNFSFEFTQIGFTLYSYDLPLVFMDSKRNELVIKIHIIPERFVKVFLPGGAEGGTKAETYNVPVRIKVVKSGDLWKVFINGNFLTSHSYKNYSTFTEFRYIIRKEYFSTFYLTDFLGVDLGD